MFMTLIQNFRQRRMVQQSMGQMLSRADDHLLEDIGLTRHDLEALIHEARAEGGQHRMPVALRAGVLLQRA
jgi:uncharacterized protein YjiS (DUF1127 family)